MPELHKIETEANYTPEQGSIVTFFAEEDDKLVLKVKKSDGTIKTLSGGAVPQETGFYKCASVDTTNQTWTGYLATFQNGTYVFSTTVTSGLSYGNGYQPVVDTIYNDDCTVIATLFTGIPTNAIKINGDSLSGDNWIVTGVPWSLNAKFGANSIRLMSPNSYISITHGLDVLRDAWTIGFFCCPYATSDDLTLLINNDDGTEGGFYLNGDSGWSCFTLNIRGGQSTNLAGISTSTWTHIRLTHIGNGVLRVYKDGTYVGTATFTGGSPTEFRIGAFISGESAYFEGCIDEVECFELTTASQIDEYGGAVSAPVPTKGY